MTHVSFSMFLLFAGFSSLQFHSYLFEAKGLSPAGVGWLLFLGSLAGFLTPWLQMALIHWWKGPRKPLLMLAALSGFLLWLLPLQEGFLGLGVFFFLYMLCATGMMPLNVAHTLEASRHRGHSVFFMLRSLGTAGFTAGCLASIWGAKVWELDWIYAGLGACSLAAIPFIQAARYPPVAAVVTDLLPGSESTSPWRALLAELVQGFRRRDTAVLIGLIGLMGFVNSLSWSVQGNYVVNVFGVGKEFISLSWAVASGLEIPLMWACAWALRRVGLERILFLGFLLTSVKLIWLSQSESLAGFVAGLGLHGAYYAAVVTGYGVFIDRSYTGRQRNLMLVFSGMFYNAVPTALGGICAGYIWQYSSLRMVYHVAAVLSVVVLFLAYRHFRPGGPLKNAFSG